MKVILLDNVRNLGNFGTEVIVKSGYARNFLIPKLKAIAATKINIAKFKAQQLELQSRAFDKKNKAKSFAKKISMLEHVIITAKSGIEGRLFGSVGARDIANAITRDSGINIDKFQIRLPNNDVLKKIGTYRIKIHIYNEIFVMLNIIIVDASSLKQDDRIS